MPGSHCLLILTISLLLLSPQPSLSVDPTAGWSIQCATGFKNLGRGDFSGWRKRIRALTGLSEHPERPLLLDGFAIEYGMRASKDQIDAFLGPVEVPEIIIITHQAERLQPATVTTLRSARFANTPTMVLESRGSFGAGAELAKEATLLQFSLIGEAALRFNAPVVHVMGGSCSLCLMETGHNIIYEALDVRKRPSLELRFHTGLVYGGMSGTVWTEETMRSRLLDRDLAKRETVARDFAQLFLEGPDEKQGVYKLSESAHNEKGFTFVFKRQDGKVVRVVLEY